MNEYKSAGDTWKLLGSAVGYVGSDEDTPLFAARKKTERLVILFDEIEKAHESIFETIMTLMEKGELTNGKGESFDFKQSIIFFTTNLAMNELLERKKELKTAGEKIDSYTFQQSVKDILRNNNVKAEVCGRINIVLIYNTLPKDTVARIAIMASTTISSTKVKPWCFLPLPFKYDLLVMSHLAIRFPLLPEFKR